MVSQAHAKINIGLDVLRRRNDGYHEIASFFVKTGLHDTIHYEKNAVLQIQTVPDLGIPQEQNICHKTALLLRERFSINDGAKITIRKHIPHGAGLGGGSSNAATTLRALNTVWNINAPLNELRPLAEQVGSDVPFFLDPDIRSAYVTGRGEHIEPVNHPFHHTLLLVNAGIHVSTPWAYTALDIQGTSESQFHPSTLAEIPVSEWRHHITNDFERVVFATHPILQSIKDELYKYGADYASMSGSGSTMYGLFTSKQDALIAANRFSNFSVFVSKLL
ncbi:MAG: 4-(cytidine 5'-diphospho)-2-C-methyl-D-erythritol kinase [Candidatus Kapabacteria bacterium]|nr:4-(cytidine 5'-diphospho)-2-C-methyl-D-erythritol kinase [Candidatus Kapabacteria bacterium]